MALEGFYFNTYDWAGVENTTVSQTNEVTFPVWTNSVHAVAPLVAFSHTEGDSSIACSGILSYHQGIADIPVGSIIGSGGFPVLFELADALWVPDSPDNWISGVTFALQLSDEGGGGFFATGADVVQRVELWD
jgi:hypothetical protein